MNDIFAILYAWQNDYVDAVRINTIYWNSKIFLVSSGCARKHEYRLVIIIRWNQHQSNRIEIHTNIRIHRPVSNFLNLAHANFLQRKITMENCRKNATTSIRNRNDIIKIRSNAENRWCENVLNLYRRYDEIVPLTSSLFHPLIELYILQFISITGSEVIRCVHCVHSTGCLRRSAREKNLAIEYEYIFAWYLYQVPKVLLLNSYI